MPLLQERERCDGSPFTSLSSSEARAGWLHWLSVYVIDQLDKDQVRLASSGLSERDGKAVFRATISLPTPDMVCHQRLLPL